MSADGRLTLPAEVRRALALDGETEFEVELNDADSVTLRAVVVMRREDAWAYTPEHRARLTAAREDAHAGRVRRLSDDDLAAIGDED